MLATITQRDHVHSFSPMPQLWPQVEQLFAWYNARQAQYSRHADPGGSGEGVYSSHFVSAPPKKWNQLAMTEA